MTDYGSFVSAAEDFVEERLRSLGLEESMGWNDEELQALLDANKILRKKCVYSGGKKKKRRDPNEPKRASSAYIWFSKENRERVKKENPDITSQDIMKKLGEEWRKLTDKGKKKYAALAAKDDVRYKKDKAAYDKTKEEAASA